MSGLNSLSFVVVFVATVIIPVTKAHFGYGDQDKWPGVCQTGQMQSPIPLSEDISTEVNFTPLIFENYDQSLPVTLVNNGHSASVTPAYQDKKPRLMGGGLGNHYTLDHLHFHWQSEHTIEEYRFPLEMHMVHYASIYSNVSEALKTPGGVSVVAVLFDLSPDDDKDFDPLLRVVERLQTRIEQRHSLQNFKISDYIPRDTAGFYRYDGSLTTPDCNEGVVWTVLTNTIPISSKQVDIFNNMRSDANQILFHNYRKLQDINDRIVYLKLSPIRRHRSASPSNNVVSLGLLVASISVLFKLF